MIDTGLGLGGAAGRHFLVGRAGRGNLAWADHHGLTRLELSAQTPPLPLPLNFKKVSAHKKQGDKLAFTDQQDLALLETTHTHTHTHNTHKHTHTQKPK